MLGFTYDFESPAAPHQNDVDLHLDRSASQLLTKGAERPAPTPGSC
jgi:hypothetical protein